MGVEALLVSTKDAAIVYHMSHFFTIGTNPGTIPDALDQHVTVSMTQGTRGGDGCRSCSRGGIDGSMRWRGWWIKQLVDINRVVTCSRFLVCSGVIGKKRIIAVTSFLNDDRSLFNLSFGDGRVQRCMKSGRRRVNWRDSSLSKSKIQNNRGYNVLKWRGMAKNIENRFSFLLVTKKILSNSFEIVRKE